MSLELSVVIPVYNEEKNIPLLGERLIKVLESLNRSYEIVFTNDGSSDKSLSQLEELYRQYPKVVRIIDFQANFGQHMAIMAALEHSRGEVVITLDADLQNPPEEIPKLLEKIDAGHDYVGSYRHNRQDTFFRRSISKVINWIREGITDIQMKDQGCMLRAYKRRVIDQVVATKESSTFIPALAYKFSLSPTEVEVNHSSRSFGESKYNLYSLIRLNFDLVTGFSFVPLQLFTILGLCLSALSGLLVVYLMIRRIWIGPEVEGVFTLFAILFFLISFLIVGVGLVGEYIGRIVQSLNQRPRYVIRQIIQDSSPKLPF